MQFREPANCPELVGKANLPQAYGNPWETGLSRCIVQDVIQGEVILQGLCDEWSLRATCGASCLLQPQPGDQVLVHLDQDEREHFVLAVLKRGSKTPNRYALSEQVNLLADGGHLRIMGHSVDLNANQSEFRIDQFRGIYKDKSEKADTITIVADLVRHQIGRLISKIRNSFRLIDGLDRTQAANIQQTAEHQILLRSNFTKLRSEHAVKVEAKKIDLG